MLARLFPLSHIRNIAMFYVLTSVYNSWFVAGVWVFIWGAFMTNTEIGISDAITFTLGFLIELPSGVMADLIGRRKAILLGNIMLTFGNLFVGLSSSFLTITLWYLLWTIGYAFQSGATEALAYDSLKQKGLEDKWKQVITTASVIGKVTSLTATALGGTLFAIGFRLPYMAATLSGVVGIVAAWYLQEIMVKKPDNLWSLSLYINQIKDGVRTLFKPQVKYIALASITIISIGYMYNWGLLRPLTGERFGFDATTYSWLLSLTSLSIIGALVILNKMQNRFSVTKILWLTTMVYAILFFILGFSHQVVVGGLLMISLGIILTYVDILFSQFINEHTSPQHRATTLSALALFTKLPYILLAVLIGKIADNKGLPAYTMIVGTVSIIVWVYSLIHYRLARKIV